MTSHGAETPTSLDPRGCPPAAASAHSRPLLWSAILAALVVVVAALGPVNIRQYGGLAARHIPIYGSWFTTLHSLMHLASFATLGALAWLISTRRWARLSGIAAVLLLGIVIEWVQCRTYRIPFETWDLRDDTIGVGLGVLSAYLSCVFRRRRKLTFTS